MVFADLCYYYISIVFRALIWIGLESLIFLMNFSVSKFLTLLLDLEKFVPSIIT